MSFIVFLLSNLAFLHFVLVKKQSKTALVWSLEFSFLNLFEMIEICLGSTEVPFYGLISGPGPFGATL